MACATQNRKCKIFRQDFPRIFLASINAHDPLRSLMRTCSTSLSTRCTDLARADDEVSSQCFSGSCRSTIIELFRIFSASSEMTLVDQPKGSCQQNLFQSDRPACRRDRRCNVRGAYLMSVIHVTKGHVLARVRYFATPVGPDGIYETDTVDDGERSAGDRLSCQDYTLPKGMPRDLVSAAEKPIDTRCFPIRRVGRSFVRLSCRWFRV